MERQDLEEIAAATKRAAALSRQLLAFSRQQVMERRVVDLNDVVREVERLLRRLIGEDIRLIVHLESRPIHVLADQGQLEQVLMNLAVNSRDAMPRGGELAIATERAETALPGDPTPRPFAVLAVSDTGVGMDDTTRTHIFEPFFTTKEPGQGTGLGLAMVYAIVQQSGGFIDLSTAPGAGAVFRIHLPLVDESNVGSAAAERAGESPAGAGTVLLVEDEEAVRRVARQILRQAGYSVIEARDGVEALATMGATGADATEVDLVLTDVVMPRMSGPDFVAELRTRGYRGPVVYVSGYTDHHVLRTGALEANASFVQKPFTAAQLAGVVGEALQGADRRRVADES
jgi:CheY-like chemotaxis protein